MSKILEVKKEIQSMDKEALKAALDNAINDLAELKMKLQMETLKETDQIRKIRRKIATMKHRLADLEKIS